MGIGVKQGKTRLIRIKKLNARRRKWKRKKKKDS